VVVQHQMKKLSDDHRENSLQTNIIHSQLSKLRQEIVVDMKEFESKDAMDTDDTEEPPKENGVVVESKPSSSLEEEESHWLDQTKISEYANFLKTAILHWDIESILTENLVSVELFLFSYSLCL
jgi:hypothetical protein